MTGVVTSYPLKGAVKTEWFSLGKDVNGDAATIMGFRDKTVTVSGDFDTVSVTLQGSNDGDNWFTLTDPQGADLVFAAGGIAAILENPLFIRPSVSDDGVGTTDVKVSIVGNS